MLAPTQGVARAAPDAAVPTATVNRNHILAHTREEFTFTVDAPADRALPLFGAVRERDWAAFMDRLYGLFHALARRVQYVYVVPGVVATVITIGLTPEGAGTRVSVRYERTALAVQANGAVDDMAARDRTAGPEWEQQIKQHLSARPD